MLTPYICEISLGLEVLVYIKQYTFTPQKKFCPNLLTLMLF